MGKTRQDWTFCGYTRAGSREKQTATQISHIEPYIANVLRSSFILRGCVILLILNAELPSGHDGGEGVCKRPGESEQSGSCPISPTIVPWHHTVSSSRPPEYGLFISRTIV